MPGAAEEAEEAPGNRIAAAAGGEEEVPGNHIAAAAAEVEAAALSC